MNRDEIIRHIAVNNNITLIEATSIIIQLFNLIRKNLEEDKKVKITNFGTFLRKRIKGKQVRNPRTGEKSIIKDFYKIKFISSDKFTKHPNE